MHENSCILPLFEFCDTGSVMNLAKTSNIMHAIIDSYSRTAWNVDQFLTSWFSSPKDFREELGQADGIISGDEVLRFMDRKKPAAGRTLHICLRVEGALPLSHFLDDQGYSFQNTSIIPGTFDAHILKLSSTNGMTDTWGRSMDLPEVVRTFKFVRTDPQRGDSYTKRIRLLIVSRDPRLIILGYHSCRFVFHRVEPEH